MILVALLLLSCSTAFTVQCTTPDMNTYSPQVSFVCTFSESVSLNHVERIFVPSLVSVSPLSGELFTRLLLRCKMTLSEKFLSFWERALSSRVKSVLLSIW